jgi:hypothetical protein
MYDKYKNNMKTLTLIAVIVLTAMTSSKSITENHCTTPHNLSPTHEDFLRHELQQSVLEFCEDMGIDPDSVYMPFRETL